MEVFKLLLMCFLAGMAASQSNGDVRLSNGATTGSGRLEIFLKETWGTICNDGFTKGAALAACRQLGYYNVQNYGTVRSLGVPVAPNSTQILLSNVNCNYDLSSNEGHILRCDFSETPLIPSDCSHNTDVAVQCSGSLNTSPYDTQVRLRGGAYHSSGTLEVYLNNQWGTVCYSGFTTSAADTACHQLGYTNSLNTHAVTDSSDITWLEDFYCDGFEYCLRQCFNYPSSSVNCNNNNQVVFLNCTFDISQKSYESAGSKSLCTYNIIGILVGAVFGVVLFFSIVIIIICVICCAIPGCILYAARPRRHRYEVIY